MNRFRKNKNPQKPGEGNRILRKLSPMFVLTLNALPELETDCFMPIIVKGSNQLGIHCASMLGAF